MSEFGKYRIIQAATLEECKRHRNLIEEALHKSGLTPQLRAELRANLDQLFVQENNIRREEDDEEERKKKKGGSGDRQGDAGGSESGGDAGSSGGSGSSGGGDGGMARDDSRDEEEQSDLEALALLFVIAEQTVDQPAPDDSDNPPMAAATLLYDRQEGVARVNEPYAPEQSSDIRAPSVFLPSLERHAATIGARVMMLKVHPDAVGMFQKKFGYTPVGKAVMRGGMPLQKMRKNLGGTMPDGGVG